MHAYCSECAKYKICNIAIYSKKISKSRKNIDIGGSNKYIPVCREHYQNIPKINNLEIVNDNSDETNLEINKVLEK